MNSPDTNDFSNYHYWINDVKDDNDKELFNEIISCIDSKSYRSASIMIWILCAESLHKKLNQFSQNNSQLVNDLKNWEENDKNEADLLDLCEKYNLINNMDYNQLNLIREARNDYAHPNFTSPSKNEVLSYLFFALNSVLSKSSQYSFLEAKNLLELLLKDPIQLGNRNSIQIRTYSRNLISKLNPKTYKSILKLLFDLTEELLIDFEPEKQKCIDIGLTLIKELILVDKELINEEKCNKFLNNSKITSCNVFSQIEIWKILDLNTRFKTFKYSSKFENEIFSEIDFINRFHKLNENDLLDYNLKEDFNKILDNTSIDLILNSEISTQTQFEKIISNFKSYDWHIQNPTAKILRQKDLTHFNDEQLEIIGRNLLQAADGRSWESQTTIDHFLRNYDDFIPESLVKGILFEIFINEEKEFRFKENYFRKPIITISSHEEFQSIYNQLLNEIKKSDAKDNRYYQYSDAIRRLKLVNDKSEIENIRKIIKTIEETRCRLIKKIIDKNPEQLLNIKLSQEIAPHVFKCLDESRKNIFKNLIKEDVIKFVTFFSTYRQSIGTGQYRYLKVEFDLIKDFINLKDLENIIKKEMDTNPTSEKESFFELFLEDYENYQKECEKND